MPHSTLLIIACLALTACAGPDAHRARAREVEAAPRPMAGEALTPADPLAVETHEAHDHEVDPTCGMTVDPKTALSASVKGKTYFFCSAGCRTSFLKKSGVAE